MKGLILSVVVFVLYVLGTMVASHLLKPSHYSRVFVPGLVIGPVVLVVLYFLTPADLGFLSPGWQADRAWLDIFYGCLVFLLNGHSYIDFFFGFNGGFSMSVMLEILRRQPRAAKTDEIVRCYLRPDGFDKIYGWRLPRLADSGMITIDREKGTCRLTDPGRRVALFARFCKRWLNVGEGG